MNKSLFIPVAFLVSVVVSVSIHAEAIGEDDVGYFQLSDLPANRYGASPKMPAPLTNVVPANAPKLTSKGHKPPGGIIPIAIDPLTQSPVVLLAHENGNVKGFSDFGGSGDETDNSREHTAVREFNEETCLAFWEDLTNQPLNRDSLTGHELEKLAQQPLTENVIPWFYAWTNKYLTCLLPVRYQSIDDLDKKLKIVRKKVTAYPFFEKHEFVWIPLEDLINWIENGIQNPTIPNGKGKPISWRFLGKTFNDFKQNTNPQIYDRIIQYLKDIITLNS